MGGKTSTSTSQVSIPPEVLARYNSVNATAQQVAQTPFQQYSTNPNAFVAPITPTQQAGIENTNAASQMAQPYYGAATGFALAGAQPVNAAPLNTSAYENPYLSTVLGSTEAMVNQQNQQAMAGQTASAINQGYFGGDRSSIASAVLQGQQELAGGQLYSGIASDAYTNALAAAQQQQGVGLGAAQANRAAVQQTGDTLAQLGTGAQSSALAGAQAQLGAGQVQQQTQQAGLTALYNQFLQQQSYPFQTAQFLANIAEGTGALSGNTTTTTQPGGLFSDERLKEDMEPIGKGFDGANIYRFRYRGDPTTRIGFSAQEMERKHPEAVREVGGFKAIEHHAATEESAERGGFANAANDNFWDEEPRRARQAGGMSGWGMYPPGVNPMSIGELLQAQAQMYGPGFGGAGLYGGSASAMPHGGSSYVPAPMGGAPMMLHGTQPPVRPQTTALDALHSAAGLSGDVTGLENDAKDVGSGVGWVRERVGPGSVGGSGTAYDASVAAQRAANTPESTWALGADLPANMTSSASGGAHGGFFRAHRQDGGDISDPQDDNPYAPKGPGLNIPTQPEQHQQLQGTKPPPTSSPGSGMMGMLGAGADIANIAKAAPEIGSLASGAAGMIGSAAGGIGSALAGLLPFLALARGGRIGRADGGGLESLRADLEAGDNDPLEDQLLQQALAPPPDAMPGPGFANAAAAAPGAPAGGGGGGGAPSAGFAGAKPPGAAASAKLGTAPAPKGDDIETLVRTVGAEADQNPLGWQSVAAVIRNRAMLSGKSLAEVASEERHGIKQFSGYGDKNYQATAPGTPKYDRILAAIQPVLAGEADPTGGADSFYAPRGMPANHPKPSWDDGSGQQIGTQIFFKGKYAGARAVGGPAGFAGARRGFDDGGAVMDTSGPAVAVDPDDPTKVIPVDPQTAAVVQANRDAAAAGQPSTPAAKEAVASGAPAAPPTAQGAATAAPAAADPGAGLPGVALHDQGFGGADQTGGDGAPSGQGPGADLLNAAARRNALGQEAYAQEVLRQRGPQGGGILGMLQRNWIPIAEGIAAGASAPTSHPLTSLLVGGGAFAGAEQQQRQYQLGQMRTLAELAQTGENQDVGAVQGMTGRINAISPFLTSALGPGGTVDQWFPSAGQVKNGEPQFWDMRPGHAQGAMVGLSEVNRVKQQIALAGPAALQRGDLSGVLNVGYGAMGGARDTPPDGTSSNAPGPTASPSATVRGPGPGAGGGNAPAGRVPSSTAPPPGGPPAVGGAPPPAAPSGSPGATPPAAPAPVAGQPPPGGWGTTIEDRRKSGYYSQQPFQATLPDESQLADTSNPTWLRSQAAQLRQYPNMPNAAATADAYDKTAALIESGDKTVPVMDRNGHQITNPFIAYSQARDKQQQLTDANTAQHQKYIAAAEDFRTAGPNMQQLLDMGAEVSRNANMDVLSPELMRAVGMLRSVPGMDAILSPQIKVWESNAAEAEKVQAARQMLSVGMQHLVHAPGTALPVAGHAIPGAGSPGGARYANDIYTEATLLRDKAWYDDVAAHGDTITRWDRYAPDWMAANPMSTYVKQAADRLGGFYAGMQPQEMWKYPRHPQSLDDLHALPQGTPVMWPPGPKGREQWIGAPPGAH